MSPLLRDSSSQERLFQLSNKINVYESTVLCLEDNFIKPAEEQTIAFGARASVTYCIIRDIHTSPSDDCKNPEAIVDDTNGQFEMWIWVFLSTLMLLPHLEIVCSCPGGVSNEQKPERERETRFIWSRWGHLKTYEVRGWGWDNRSCVRHGSRSLAYQLKPNQGAIKD